MKPATLPLDFIGVVWDFLFVEIVLRESRPFPRGGEYWGPHVRSVTLLAWFALLLLNFAFVFLGYRVNFPGGGIIGCFTVGVGANLMMARRAAMCTAAAKEKKLFISHANPLAKLVGMDPAPTTPLAISDMQARMARLMTDFWEYVAVPLLFSMLGSSISLPMVFQGAFFWRALVCTVVGAATRALFAMLCTFGMAMTRRERVITGLVFTARATAQIAFGQIVALALASGSIVTYGGVQNNPPALQIVFAQRIANVAVLSVLIFAPFSAILLAKVAPHMMMRDEDWDAMMRRTGGEQAPSGVEGVLADDAKASQEGTAEVRERHAASQRRQRDEYVAVNVTPSTTAAMRGGVSPQDSPGTTTPPQLQQELLPLRVETSTTIKK
jgi:hypothetical protein